MEEVRDAASCTRSPLNGVAARRGRTHKATRSVGAGGPEEGGDDNAGSGTAARGARRVAPRAPQQRNGCGYNGQVPGSCSGVNSVKVTELRNLDVYSHSIDACVPPIGPVTDTAEASANRSLRTGLPLFARWAHHLGVGSSGQCLPGCRWHPLPMLRPALPRCPPPVFGCPSPIGDAAAAFETGVALVPASPRRLLGLFSLSPASFP